jgi:3-phenylpropionate/trans-cinnamate dioxygenase ferredoxin subunit
VNGEKFVVARVEEIPEGERKMVVAGKRELAVFHVDGEFFALLNRCPHQGGPLCHGELLRPITSERPGEYSVDTERRLIACPWHGWEFDLHTGRSFFDPARFKARPFPVEVEGGEEIRAHLDGAACPPTDSEEPVEGPYRAPLLPVAIEDDYVVVTIPGRRPSSVQQA